MKIGPFEIIRHKSYKQLVQMIEREKKTSAEDPKTDPKRQLAEYRSWVSSCVSLISDRISTVPYKFYRKDTDEEITSRNHAYKVFTKPFFNPNPLMSFRFIKAWCQVQWDMCGMSCIYKVRNGLGQIWELWPLNMNDFMGVYDKKGMPIDFTTEILPDDVFYIFHIGGKPYTFSNFDLVILNYPHPFRPFYGASPIQSQAYSIDTQKYIEVYERDFFYNSARVDMVLVTEQEVDDDRATRIKERWLEKYSYGSGGKFHDITVLSHGLKPEPLKFTNRDFEFMNLAQWTKDMVLSSYRINPAKLGNTEKTNRAASVQVDIDFNRDCIQPRLTQWDEEFNKEVLSDFDSRIELRHDNPIPRDRLIEMQEGRIFLAGVPSMTVDEYRYKKHNLPKTEGGDELIVPSTFIPISKLGKMWDAKIKQMEAQAKASLQSQTDPMRHQDDEPHLRPDGGDDRDDNPTEGRNIESYLRKHWKDGFYENMELFFQEDSTNLFFKAAMGTILTMINKKANLSLGKDEWIDSYAEKASKEFFKTLWKEAETKNFSFISDKDGDDRISYITSQLDRNHRLAKICNATLRSCINYVRFKYLDTAGLKKIWIVNSNICGHQGRVKNFETNGSFVIGDSEIRFPGETFNLSCDCEIHPVQDQKLLF